MAVQQNGMGPGGAGGYVPDPAQWSQLTADSHILGTGQYDYGDFIHDHHRRHHHKFHDHHYVTGAHETLDLSNPPQVQSHVIPAAGGAGAQFQLRPDVFGKWAFDNGASQYGFGMGFTAPMGSSGGPAPPPAQPQMMAPMGPPPAMMQTPPPAAPPQHQTMPSPLSLSGMSGHRSIITDYQSGVSMSAGPGGSGPMGSVGGPGGPGTPYPLNMSQQ